MGTLARNRLNITLLEVSTTAKYYSENQQMKLKTSKMKRDEPNFSQYLLTILTLLALKG